MQHKLSIQAMETKKKQCALGQNGVGSFNGSTTLVYDMAADVWGVAYARQIGAEESDKQLQVQTL